MRSIAEQRWGCNSAEETCAMGVRFGMVAQKGDFIACCGTLGAGKTTFVQGFARGIGIDADAYVRSPTFALINEYTGRIPLYHFDFY